MAYLIEDGSVMGLCTNYWCCALLLCLLLQDSSLVGTGCVVDINVIRGQGLDSDVKLVDIMKYLGITIEDDLLAVE